MSLTCEGLRERTNKLHNSTMKLRKSPVKPVTWQKSCNYIELFGSSARERHARCI